MPMTTYRRVATLLAPVGLLFLAAAADPPSSPSRAPSSSEVVARRGDVKLTADDVRAMLAEADPAARAKADSSPSALAAFVRQKIINDALLAEAKAKGWDQKPDIVQRMNDARDTVVLQTYAASLVPPDPNFPPDALVLQTYDANATKFMIPRQYHLAQIAILVPQNAKPEVDEAARKKADELRAQAVKPKANFAQLAKKNSQEKSTAEKGGDSGWAREDVLLPPVRSAVADLKEGGVSEVIRLPDGYHIIRLLDIKPPMRAPLEDVRPQIVQALRQARTQQGINVYINDMLKTQPIQLNEIDLANQVSDKP
ncbi:MAG TPA: peptidylprolyl isomerase [Rhodopila sp.]|nr:peptidylprolyl isomerase [Rhodopila sp.]